MIQTYGIDTNVDIVIAGDTDYGIGNSIDDSMDDSIDTLFTRIHSIHSTAYDAGKCVYRIVEIHELDGIHGIHAVHAWAPSELNDGYTGGVYGDGPKFPIWWTKNLGARIAGPGRNGGPLLLYTLTCNCASIFLITYKKYVFANSAKTLL